MKSYIKILLIFGLFSALFTQTYFIEGYVRDKRTGKQIPNVNVFIPGTRIGSSTNIKGRFTLRLVVTNADEIGDELESTVAAKISGYKRFTAPVKFEKDKRLIKVVIPLEEDLFFDDEDIITNFSSSGNTRRLVGYSLDYIPQNYLNKTTTNNIYNVLRSQISSMHVIGNSGSVTSGYNMLMRGNQTFFGSSSPTIYVDGIKYDSENVSGGFNSGGQTINRLNDVNIYDIEKIEVLRGAASTALYGSEGANGIIQIFTKNGYPGQRRFHFYAKPSVRSRSISAPNQNTSLLVDEQQNSLLLLNNIGASIRGGQQDHQYYVSLNYLGNTGLLDQESISNISLKSNFKFVMSKFTEFNVKSGYSRNLTNRMFGENSSAGPYSSSLTLTDAISGSERTRLQETLLQQEVSKYTTSLNFIFSPDNDTQVNGHFGFDITDQLDALEFNSFSSSSNIFQSNSRKVRTFSSRLSLFKKMEINSSTTLNMLFGTNFNSATTNRSINTQVGVLPPLYTLEESDYMTPLADYSLSNQQLGLYGKFTGTFNKWLTAEAGARYDKTTFADSDFTNVFPFASLNYLYILKKKEFLKGFIAFGTAGRTPNIHESINYNSYKIDNLETTSEIEAGVEYKFLDGKFKSRVSFFNNSTSNAYVLNTQDLTDFNINSNGEISSTGIEFTISGFPYRKDKLSHFIQFGFTSVSTTINNTGSSDIILGPFKNLPNGGSAAFQKNGNGLEFYLPTEVNGVANSSVSAGNILPTFYGSFNNYIKYDKFSLDIISNFAYGHKILNLTKNYQDHIDLTKDNLFLNTDVEDAGWFKIRELIVSYHMELGINKENNATISFAIENVMTFSNYSGDDPEASAFTYGGYTNSGIDFQSLSPVRTYNIRLMLDI